MGTRRNTDRRKRLSSQPDYQSDYVLPTSAQIYGAMLHPIAQVASLEDDEWEKPMTPRLMLALFAWLLDEATDCLRHEGKIYIG